MKKICMWMFLVLFALAIVGIVPLQASAATTLTNPATNLSATIDGSTHSLGLAYSGEASEGKVTLKVTSIRSVMNGTLTLTNIGSKDAVLSFSYEVSGGVKSFTIAGNTVSNSGTYNAELGSGESINIYLEANQWTSLNPAKVELTNVALVVTNAAQLTIGYNDYGTVKVGGTTTASETTIEVEASGTTLEAVASSGATFLGWVNTTNNTVYSMDASFTYVPTGNLSLTAIFAHPDGEACFWGSSKKYLFEGLAGAISHTTGATDKTIVLAANGTLSSGDYTIPSGVTLLIPFDADHTCYTTTPGYVEGTWKKPTAFRTLTMADGANITVNGAISVSAKVATIQGSVGTPTYSYGLITMNTGSTITVKSGGNLYAWGYITGDGEILAKSGSAVYESFQVADWRGGTASSGMLGNSQRVFPMTQYYVQNVEASLTWESGAKEYCSMIADIISVRQVVVNFIGASGCLFNLSSGTATKHYDGDADRLYLDINGDFSLGNIDITLLNLVVTKYEIKTGSYDLPINGGYTLNLNSGSITFNVSVAMLPGSQLNIAEGTTVYLKNNASLFVYGEEEWKEKYYVFSNAYFRPVKYAVSRTETRTNDDIVDAAVLVNGTLDATAGNLFTTASGANIYSTANGTVKMKAVADVKTYQAVQTGTDIEYAQISITSAKLKNSTTTYTDYVPTATHGANTYVYGSDGIWHVNGCAGFNETNTATCTEAGTYTAKCTCYLPCDCHGKVEDIPALGHSWGAWTTDHTTHTSACGREGCEACVTLLLEYRLDSYTWLNATVTAPDELEATLAEGTAAGYTFKLISGKYYLVRQIHAKEIPTAFTATLTVGGKPLEPLDISFAAYKEILEANNNTSDATRKLLAAMVAYGEAAEDHFVGGFDGTVAEFDKDNTPSANATGEFNKQKYDGVILETTSVNIWFDEALRLGVSYHLSGNYNGYTVVQVGLLIGEDWDGKTALTTAEGGYGMAYLVFAQEGTVTPGGSANVPNANLTNSYNFANTFAAEGSILFDLSYAQYMKKFSVRPFVVLQDGDGETHCVYGHQYGYSLEAYVNRMYNRKDAEGKYIAPDSFRNLLVHTWNYAIAASDPNAYK